ncbi:MAG: hypothetical protein ACI9GM_000324 [Salibacteraceae bacterium]|jgi:hypothetical protein
MKKEFTDSVFMVRPANFGINIETALTNSFQSKIAFTSPQEIAQMAVDEFDGAVEKLRGFDVEVSVFQDTDEPIKPDAVFPNNWISTHSSQEVFIYPMLTENRKVEVREDVIQELFGKKIIDLRNHENQTLEGTGSMVIDHEWGIIYYCKSERTHDDLVKKVAEILNFMVCGFHAADHQNKLIYHTNVVMFVMNDFVGIGLETIKDKKERDFLIHTIEASGKQVLDLSYYQITQFAGNMLQLKTKSKGHVLVCSETAWNSMTEVQKLQIERKTKICILSISTIELYGGGSARCMIAENFI